MNRDPWDGMQHVDVTGTRLPRVGLGMHLLKVVRCTVPRDKVAFIVEFEVLQSNAPDHAPGQQRSVYLSSKFPESLQKQVKACLAAICGFDPKNVAAVEAFSPFSPTVARAAKSEANVLQGRTVACEGSASGRVDNRTGQPYCNYVWMPAEAPMQVQLIQEPAPAPAPYPPATNPLAHPANPFAFGAAPPAPAFPMPAMPNAYNFAAPAPAANPFAFGAQPAQPAAPAPAAQPAGPPGWSQVNGQWVRTG